MSDNKTYTAKEVRVTIRIVYDAMFQSIYSAANTPARKASAQAAVSWITLFERYLLEEFDK